MLIDAHEQRTFSQSRQQRVRVIKVYSKKQKHFKRTSILYGWL